MPLDGRTMAGDWIEVVPLSTSFVPDDVPASRPVTRSLTPLTVVPCCFVPVEVVVSGLPRSHNPEVAVSVPLGFLVQPLLVSKSSENNTGSATAGDISISLTTAELAVDGDAAGTGA